MAECELVKIDINCHIQGDVVLECICLRGDKEHEVIMFRAMFNTAFIRSNILMLNRDEIDILWDVKDLFPKDFRAEVLFSEMDSVASMTPVDCSCFEEKDGLPVEAFVKVQEIFSSVDWLVPTADATVEVIQHLTADAYSYAEKCQVNQSLAALDVKTVAKSTTCLNSVNQSNLSPKLSPNTDVERKQDDPRYGIGAIIPLEQTLSGDILHNKTLLSTPVFHSTKSAGDGPGHSLSIPATFPILSSLKDEIGAYSGVSPLPVLPPESPSASTLPLRDDTTVSPSTFHKKVARFVVSQSESFSLTVDVVEATSVATAPPPHPSLPPTYSSSIVDVGEPTTCRSPSIATQSSALNVIESTVDGSSPHIFYLETDATVKTTPPLPPPAPLYTTPAEECPASTCAPTPAAPSPMPTSHLRKDLDSEVGSRPPVTLTERSGNKLSPPPPPPPPPLVHRNESSSLRCGPLPTSPTPQVSHFEEHSESGVVPPPPLTPPLRDNLVSRHAPCPPSPPPEPPKKIGGGSTFTPPPLTPPLRDKLVPCPPPPPPPPEPPKEKSTGGEPSPHSGKDAPPLAPHLRNSSVAKPAPCPPPPPPEPPREGSTRGGPPLPPPPPHSGHSVRPTNSLAPTNYLGPTTSSPSVPSAPPPPLLSPKEPAGLSSPVPSGNDSGRGSGSPSPPPPSTPPLGTRGKSFLSRTQTSRNQSKKLKPLHWLKLSRAVSGSLWAEAQKSGEASRAPEIDISELESLFSAAVPNSGEGGSSKKSGSRGSMGKSEKVQLIDHRRAYNCEIMLSKVKIPLHDMLSLVLALEDSALDVDQVDNLIKFCPTKEEMEVVKGFKGEKDKLGKCEQFFLELMQVPRIEFKLRVFSFKIQFHTQVSDLRSSLSVVNSAAEQGFR
ncbi:hypothetical protein OROMI_018550 [Orobanche minor]